MLAFATLRTHNCPRQIMHILWYSTIGQGEAPLASCLFPFRGKKEQETDEEAEWKRMEKEDQVRLLASGFSVKRS